MAIPTMAKRKARALTSHKGSKKPKSTSTDDNQVRETIPMSRNRKEVHVQAQSPLLSLPPELRTIIFQLALTKKPRTTLMDKEHDNSQDAEPSLIRTCWLARLEGLPVFYGQNDWIVKGWLTETLRNIPGSGCIFYSKWLGKVDAKKIAMMQTIFLVRHDFSDMFMPSTLIAPAWKLCYLPRHYQETTYSIEFVNLDGSSDTELFGDEYHEGMKQRTEYHFTYRGSTKCTKHDMLDLFTLAPVWETRL